MIHVAAFSGGKDSTAVILWLREQGIEHRTIFCDTGWEHPLTYDFIRELDAKLGLNVEWLRSKKYPGGFHQLAVERHVVPGVRSRFCTEELKLYPLHEFIESLDDDTTIYQGIRAEESFARSRMPARVWNDAASGYWIERPILGWTAEDVFAAHKRHGIAPNPLYLRGMKRVGCAPCVMVGKPELRQWALQFPEIKQKLEKLEKDLNKGRKLADRAFFFRSDYIPERFQKTHRVTTKDGRNVSVPSVSEVFDYVTEIDRVQLDLLKEEPTRCLSIYNLCE